MSQRTTLQQLDTDIIAAFDVAGMAEAAVLQRADGTVLACTVMLDLQAERFGTDGQVVTVPAVITAFLSEVTTPPVRGEVFVVDGEAWTVDAKDNQDQSSVALRCKAGAR